MKYGFARSGAAKKNVLVCYTPLDARALRPCSV